MGLFGRIWAYFEYLSWVPTKKIRAALLLDAVGNTEAAAEHLQRLLATAPRASPVAGLWQVVGLLYMKLDNYQEAEQALLRARDIFHETVGLDHPDARELFEHLAAALQGQDRLDEALLMTETSLKLKTECRGPHHPSLAMPLYTLAHIAVRQQDLESAIAHLKRALAVQEGASKFEQDLQLMALILGDLATLEEATGYPDEAAAHLQQAFVHCGVKDPLSLKILDRLQFFKSKMDDGSLLPDSNAPIVSTEKED